jgi:hypothetical protein
VNNHTILEQLSFRSHAAREAIDEHLGCLADLDGIASDDLHGEFVEHLIEDRNASLAVKLPAFIDGLAPNELSAKFGNFMLAVFNFSGELP